MQPDAIELALYQRALSTKIRPPRAERIQNIIHSRLITLLTVAGAALACTFAITSRPQTNTMDGSGQQITDTDPYKRQIMRSPSQFVPAAPDAQTTTIAMSRVGE